MPSKTLWKGGAVLLALAFSLALVPALNSAERAPKVGQKLFLRQPGHLLNLVFPWLGGGQEGGVTVVKSAKSTKPSIGRVKPTDVLPIQRPGGGD
jgi:hypothetical protein